MNAVWLHRISQYKNGPHALSSARAIIGTKIKQESSLLKRYGIQHGSEFQDAIQHTQNIQELLLVEARAARSFWHSFSTLIPNDIFIGRKAHSPDPINRLLDIGYHHLTHIVKKALLVHTIPTDLALIHRAHRTDSAPLAYDLVELFRADIIDAEVLRYVRLKKKHPFVLKEKDIPRFLKRVNNRIEHRYYFKDFSSCRTYRYYIDLQILKFQHAINHNEAVQFISLPTRHDTRCKVDKHRENDTIKSRKVP